MNETYFHSNFFPPSDSQSLRVLFIIGYIAKEPFYHTVRQNNTERIVPIFDEIHLEMYLMISEHFLVHKSVIIILQLAHFTYFLINFMNIGKIPPLVNDEKRTNNLTNLEKKNKCVHNLLFIVTKLCHPYAFCPFAIQLNSLFPIEYL